MEKRNKKQAIIGITLLLLVTLTLLGITYAYYRTRIIGNENDKSISVTSKVLELTYSDDNAVISANDIEPGDTLTKIFTVSNTGDDTVSYALVFDNVVSTFIRNYDWTYVLKKNGTVVREEILPSTNSYVLSTISIDADVTDEYTLDITYVNSSEDQSIDMGASLSLRVNIKDAVEMFNNAGSGTLLKAIGNDNTISEPLTVPGQVPSSLANFNEGTFKANVYTTNVSSTYQNYYLTYADGYKFNEKTGQYTLTGVKTGKYSEIYANLAGKYLSDHSIYDVFNSEDIATNSENLYIIYQVQSASLTSYSSKGKDYATANLMNEAILSATEDDYGTSYYYRGSVNNNFVNFSGMCWRIVRVQGDGTIKLILADEANLCNSSNYSIDNDASGYIAGGDAFAYKYYTKVTDSIDDMIYETSDVKAVIEAWLNGGEYEYYQYSDAGAPTVEKGTFTKKIDDTKLSETEWCSDVSLSRSTYYDPAGDDTTDPNLALGTRYYYSGADRLIGLDTASPNLRCNFTGMNNSSAVKYESKIGLLTSDEVAFAGSTGYDYSNRNMYDYSNYLMYNGACWWLMTPHSYEQEVDMPFGFVGMMYNGPIKGINIDFDGWIRPVVVLRNDVTISGGDGTQSSPYVIS